MLAKFWKYTCCVAVKPSNNTCEHGTFSTRHSRCCLYYFAIQALGPQALIDFGVPGGGVSKASFFSVLFFSPAAQRFRINGVFSLLKCGHLQSRVLSARYSGFDPLFSRTAGNHIQNLTPGVEEALGNKSLPFCSHDIYIYIFSLR